MTGESHAIKKAPDHHPVEGSTPFLISGSKITDGSGFGLVMCVGVHSQIGILRASLEVEPEDTPLQLKLTDLAEMIGNIGMAGAALAVAGCTLGLLIKCVYSGEVVDLSDSSKVSLVWSPSISSSTILFSVLLLLLWLYLKVFLWRSL